VCKEDRIRLNYKEQLIRIKNQGIGLLPGGTLAVKKIGVSDENRYKVSDSWAPIEYFRDRMHFPTIFG
jgi:hypothetical protein